MINQDSRSLYTPPLPPRLFFYWVLSAVRVCSLPGFRQQDDVLVRRGGFWEVVKDGEPMLQQRCAVVREQNVEGLHVALLRANAAKPNTQNTK